MAIQFVKVNVDTNGILTAIDHDILNFQPVRTFVITQVPPGMVRGGHAHRVCRQFLIVLTGMLQVDLRTPDNLQSIKLKAGDSIEIPAMVWSRQKFVLRDTNVLVFADQLYDKDDYIHDLNEFLQECKTGKGNETSKN